MLPEIRLRQYKMGKGKGRDEDGVEESNTCAAAAVGYAVGVCHLGGDCED